MDDEEQRKVKDEEQLRVNKHLYDVWANAEVKGAADKVEADKRHEVLLDAINELKGKFEKVKSENTELKEEFEKVKSENMQLVVWKKDAMEREQTQASVHRDIRNASAFKPEPEPETETASIDDVGFEGFKANRNVVRSHFYSHAVGGSDIPVGKKVKQAWKMLKVEEKIQWFYKVREHRISKKLKEL